MYPNPATSAEVNIYFTLSSSKYLDVNIYNIEGKLIQALMSGQTKGQVAGEVADKADYTSKTRMPSPPDKRFSGLPGDAGNKNVDKRTERRVG